MTLTVSSNVAPNTASAEKYSLLRNREHSLGVNLPEEKQVSVPNSKKDLEKDSFQDAKHSKKIVIMIHC